MLSLGKWGVWRGVVSVCVGSGRVQVLAVRAEDLSSLPAVDICTLKTSIETACAETS